MPELPEVEASRRLVCRALGRPIRSVAVPDPHCLKPDTTVATLEKALVGRRLTGARRRGKLLLVDAGTRTLGLHFGMTGVLEVDGTEARRGALVEESAAQERWLRLALHFADGGRLALHDPRRLGRVQLDPAEALLGPDALTLSLAELRQALGATRPPGPALKARLLDQRRLAGVGNLVADEVLWRGRAVAPAAQRKPRRWRGAPASPGAARHHGPPARARRLPPG